MTERMTCAYCYRPAVMRLSAGRRTALEALFGRPARSVSICRTKRCRKLAGRFLRAYDGAIR